MNSFSHTRPAVLALCTLALLAGCASGSPPNAELARSTAAVNDAVSAGATELSPAELKSAQDKLAAAQKAAADDEFDNARRLALEAESDAKLAETRSRSAKTQKAAATVQDDIRVLREEMNRAQTPPATTP